MFVCFVQCDECSVEGRGHGRTGNAADYRRMFVDLHDLICELALFFISPRRWPFRLGPMTPWDLADALGPSDGADVRQDLITASIQRDLK